LAIVVGILGGLAAVALEQLIEHGTHLLVGRFAHFQDARVLQFHVGVLLLPTLGGLASGLAMTWLCPHSFGHGTDALTHAFHRNMGNFELKGPLVKGVAAAGVISCGGSAGPEGPIAAIGAAIGSTVGKLFRLTPRERRVFLVAGCAAGIGAIFQCPLGGALFAAEILYSEPEFESDAIVPSFIASVIGYSTFMLFPGFGNHMLSGAATFAFASPIELIPYAMLGLLCGGLAIVLSLSLRFVERLTARTQKLPRWATPAVGGLATGAIALIVPQVMDGRYRFIQNAMDGSLFTGYDRAPIAWATLFATVVLMKCVATAFTVGSGGSGGVLGPGVFIGGAAGAFLGSFLGAVYPGSFPESLRQALIPVGMGGVLAATMRTPLAAVVMVTEMTGSYGLIVPLMLVCTSAYVVGRRYGLNHEQVKTAADSPVHAADAILHLLEATRVDAYMERDWPLIASPEMTLRDLVQRIKPGTRPVFAVLKEGRLVGLISVPDIRKVMEEPQLIDALIADDMMTERLNTIAPDQDLYEALEVFNLENHECLPVVTADQSRRFLGMLSREHIYNAVREHMAATQDFIFREHAGLAAIDQESRLQQLVMGVTPEKTDNVQRLMVPFDAVGKSLKEADFRNQFGAEVIAIEMPDGTIQCPPDINAPLTPSVRLVAVVWDRKPPQVSDDS
jgi:CIC family chloride channel protein